MAEGNYQIPLVWSGDSVNSKWDPYAALLIPVKLENCPDQYYMQFDPGSPNTILYMDELKDISARYPSIGMGGMTGNRLFLQSILVLDTRNRKFGIIMDKKTTNLQEGKTNRP